MRGRKQCICVTISAVPSVPDLCQCSQWSPLGGWAFPSHSLGAKKSLFTPDSCSRLRMFGQSSGDLSPLAVDVKCWPQLRYLHCQCGDSQGSSVKATFPYERVSRVKRQNEREHEKMAHTSSSVWEGPPIRPKLLTVSGLGRRDNRRTQHRKCAFVQQAACVSPLSEAGLWDD